MEKTIDILRKIELMITEADLRVHMVDVEESYMGLIFEIIDRNEKKSIELINKIKSIRGINATNH